MKAVIVMITAFFVSICFIYNLVRNNKLYVSEIKFIIIRAIRGRKKSTKKNPKSQS